MSSAIDQPERRNSPRQEIRRDGFVKVQGMARTPCVVLNISASGALLELLDAIELPQVFKLNIDADLFEADCVVRHSDGRRYGVEFTSNRQGAIALYG